MTSLHEWKRTQVEHARSFFPLDPRGNGGDERANVQCYAWRQPWKARVVLMSMWAAIGTVCDSITVRGVEQIASGDLPTDVLAEHLPNLIQNLGQDDEFTMRLRWTLPPTSPSDREVWIALCGYHRITGGPPAP